VSEKIGEELSEFDETDRKRLYMKIDEENLQNEMARRGGDVVDEFYDIDKIADRDIIKEEEECVDTSDFNDYLK